MNIHKSSDIMRVLAFKNTNREKPPSNKTQVLTEKYEYKNLGAGMSNQLFIRGCYTQNKIYKKLK